LSTSVPIAGDKRVTAHYIQSIVSVHGSVLFQLVTNQSEIYGYQPFDVSFDDPPWPEHNPYRPRIPEQLVRLGDDYYDFAEENQQILREQHNITQAGDTTFPFQLLARAHDDKLYKLGAIGRFYHEDYGVILARYVQFSEMKTVPVSHSPVGLFKKANSLDWVVTNDISLSHPDLVVGVAAPFTLPTESQFGWVIVDGPNLQQLQNDSTTSAIGESLTWHNSGTVSNTAEGKILGRRVNKAGSDNVLAAGQLWVRVESLSEASLAKIVDAANAALAKLIADLTTKVNGLPTSTNLASLQASVTALTTKLSLEITNRQQVDAAIEAQLAALDAVTSTQLDNAITNLSTTIEAQLTNLQSQLDAVRALAQAAMDKANLATSGTLQAQIDAILQSLANEINHPKGRFPVVDGSVPPNLVYMPDGSLVYVETF
jgi:hypothetical protein